MIRRRPLEPSPARHRTGGDRIWPVIDRIRAWPWPAWITPGRAALVVAVVAVLALALPAVRGPLSERLWPESRIQQLRDEGALALARGRLTSSDGRGARELYEAALALDPDRLDVRSDLARVGQTALRQARHAIAERRFADAHRALRLARELAAPRTSVDAVTETLREREAAVAGIDRMLEAAARARADGRLEGDADSALALYQRVLALVPDHLAALEGREDTLADLLQRAGAALHEGRLVEAADTLERVRRADPGHVDLPAAMAAFAQRLDQQRRRGETALRRGRLEHALREYDAVLDANPGDAGAAQGRVAVGEAYARRSERYAADFRFGPADAALRQARAIAPESAAVVAAQAHFERARSNHLRLRGAEPDAAARRRLDTLLREAAAAEARGDLITPPGESAFDRLRVARELAPRDARVRRALARLVPAARECFDSELRGNRLTRARKCLDAWRVLEGDGAGVADARRRLASRWVAYGNERLGAGEQALAQRALDAARALDPNTEGLAELDARLTALGPAQR